MGAAPGGVSGPPSFFSSVLTAQFTMVPSPSSSGGGDTGLLMDILRTGGVTTATSIKLNSDLMLDTPLPAPQCKDDVAGVCKAELLFLVFQVLGVREILEWRNELLE